MKERVEDVHVLDVFRGREHHHRNPPDIQQGKCSDMCGDAHVNYFQSKHIHSDDDYFDDDM